MVKRSAYVKLAGDSSRTVAKESRSKKGENVNDVQAKTFSSTEYGGKAAGRGKRSRQLDLAPAESLRYRECSSC